MPSDAEQLAAIKSQTLELIRQITLHPKPSYSIDGQNVSWSEYLRRLQQTVQWCQQQQAAGEPFEIQTRGDT